MQAVTTKEKMSAEAKIRLMRSSLKKWLYFRQRNDKAAQGLIKAKIPAEDARRSIETNRDWEHEQKLAQELHALLSEIGFDPRSLPRPNINQNPMAAVQLAKVAISGKVAGEVPSPSEQGLVWLWPAVAVVGLVMVTIMMKIRSDADLAKRKEELECIKIGACTDTGFWFKLGGIAVVGWLAWEKLGVRKAVTGR